MSAHYRAYKSARAIGSTCHRDWPLARPRTIFHEPLSKMWKEERGMEKTREYKQNNICIFYLDSRTELQLRGGNYIVSIFTDTTE